MEKVKAQRRVQIGDSEGPEFDGEDPEESRLRLRPSDGNVTEDQEPFMGVKVRRKASLYMEYKGDYLDVPSRPFLMKILQKQGLSLSSHRNLFPLAFRDPLTCARCCCGTLRSRCSICLHFSRG